ncbi:MAG: RNA-binding protein [Chloroflexi bacterium]|nr:RNA-binding protein [Chloroflexota bacterium]MCL5074843.1 RNA-binding protein [Chloroflexota bacterium]
MATKLYVGGLSLSTTVEELKAFFGKVGTVESATIVADKFSGQSRGFGFVEMSTNQEAQQAIQQLNGQILGGQAIVVNEARPQKERGGFRRGSERPGGSRRW